MTTTIDEATNTYIKEKLAYWLNYSAQNFGFIPLYGEWYVRKEAMTTEPIHASFILSRMGNPMGFNGFNDGDSYDAVKEVLQSERFKLLHDVCGLSPSAAWNLYMQSESTKNAILDTEVELPYLEL